LHYSLKFSSGPKGHLRVNAEILLQRGSGVFREESLCVQALISGQRVFAPPDGLYPAGLAAHIGEARGIARAPFFDGERVFGVQDVGQLVVKCPANIFIRIPLGSAGAAQVYAVVGACSPEFKAVKRKLAA